MATITVPINKDLEIFIEEEVTRGEKESKAHLVRYALERLREERALSRIEEARRDIKEGRVYSGDLRKLLKKIG
jgi:Arc/MetJ-type ribon-helix-helix transcriptional regulator